MVCCGKQGLALVHQESGKWSDPIYLDYFPTIYDTCQIAENGNVLALKSAGNPKDEYNKEFSVLSYTSVSKNQWSKKRLNPEGKYLSGDFLMSDNGENIYWTQD